VISLVDAYKRSASVFRGSRLHIRIFERDPAALATGLPYSLTQSPLNIMNDSANYMSVRGYEDPQHFMRWLKDNQTSRWGSLCPEVPLGLSGINPNGFFLPRLVVGMYLQDQC
jgi:uncharacterized NAD(P)/FAD-binding protein YdhS